MITVEASRARFRPVARRVRQAARKALSRLTKRPVYVGVFLVSDKEMKAMNRSTRGKNKCTNVLSFPDGGAFVDSPRKLDKVMPHPELPRGTRALGEIFLAPDFIVRKKEDIEFLLIHGLLHLFGYTHGKARDRIEMERKEDELYGVYAHRIGRRFEHGARRGRRKHA